MTKYIDELNEKYNNGEISLNEKSKLYEEYLDSQDYKADVEYENKKSAEQTKTTIENKSSNEKDRIDILLVKLDKAEKHLNRISKNVLFFFWFTIINLVVAFFWLLFS